MKTAETPDATVGRQGSSGEGAEGAGGGKGLWAYLLIGIYLGIVFTKTEVISWFRIQEMFRFQSFHMYGIIGGAVLVGAISVGLIKRWSVRPLTGEPLELDVKESGRINTRYWLGGTAFGLGWGLLGACPGPIFALIGNGVTVMLVALASAVAGTWVYGYLRPRLPHY